MSTEPIINPSFLYWIDVLKSVEAIAWVAGGICAVVAIVCLIWYAINAEDLTYTKFERERKSAKIGLKISLPVVLVCALLVSFIPSERTIYSMMIADKLTQANIQYVGDTVEDCIDYLFEKVDTLLDDGSDEGGGE